MNKIISLRKTKITPLIFLSSRIVISTKESMNWAAASTEAINRVSTGPFDLNYRYETILDSKDVRFLSHTFTWCSTFAYFSSFRLFHYTLWMHNRIAGKIRHRLNVSSKNAVPPSL